ncbi:slit homolog 1 protein [Agrilus planipennis]|uniref:Slit homolog 1 protein n=1 Tax=Agrilus planipennis TaxID=224129 RepID=A0A1W4WS03_AGRPL|nr:slit homolog 1 protein [Agrilus planipennis]
MKYNHLPITIVLIFISGQECNIRAHCESEFYLFSSKYNLICSGIGNLPSEELHSYFNNGYQLNSIHISNSILKRIPTNFFHQFDQVQEINLNHCEIDMLEANCFMGLQQLQKLFLNNNNISTIDGEVFSFLVDVSVVDLSENVLETIDKTAFKNLFNLEELFLNGNKLEVIPDELFSATRKIRHIDLSRNSLKMLSNGIFSNLTELLTLNLDNNELEELASDLFKDLSKLERLSMSSNALKRISYESLLGLENIKYFDISNNEIITLDYECNFSVGAIEHNISFEKLPNLTDSCCNKTDEEVLMVGLLLRLNNLEELHLEENNISEIRSESLRGLTKLKRLFLSNNCLHVIHTSAFEDLSSLELLELDNNNLQSINTTTFNKLWKLKSLQLNNNRLHSLPVSVFRDLEQLNDLSIANNLLTYIPHGLLSPLQHLKYFNISNNHLTQLNMAWFHTAGPLFSLDVSNNNINSLDGEKLVKLLPNFEIIYLKGNFWSCDKLFNIIGVFETANVEVRKGDNLDTENINGIKCTTTTSLRIFNNNQSNSIDGTYGLQKLANVLLNLSDKLDNSNNLMKKIINIVGLDLTKYNGVNLSNRGATSGLQHTTTVNMDTNKFTGSKQTLQGILNNSKITIKLLEDAVQEEKIRYPNLDTIRTQSVHSEDRVTEITSANDVGKTYALIFLGLAFAVMAIMFAYKHFQAKKRNFIIDGIRHIRFQQQSRSNIDLMPKDEIEVVNSRK